LLRSNPAIGLAILGGMMEENLRRALLIWDGCWAFLWQRPITATIVTLSLLTIAVPAVSSVLQKRRARVTGVTSE
ncbi:MAG: hypothetical protein ACPHZ8_04955, partial [Porticoccaceae bacterium]